MDRSREARRSNMATSNGLSRRRQRSTGFRDTREEDGQMQLQETVTLRERLNKRDRDFSNRNKRRKGDRFVQVSNREEGEESSEESVSDEDDYEAEDGGATRILPLNTTTPTSSYQNHRKSLPPPRLVKQAPPLKVADEMIGVLVPRKARSVSVKRSHEYWVSGNGGFGEDQSQRRASTSPSVEAVSPSSLNVSARKKTKPNGPKTRVSKVSKSSDSVQDDIEIEIAEVLSGLKKQSQSSKKEESSGNSWQRLESKDTNGTNHETKSSVSSPTVNYSQTSNFPQNNCPAPDPLPAPKEKKVEAENSSVPPVQNSSIGSAVNVDSEQPAKMEISSQKLDTKSRFNAESYEASQNTDAHKASSVSLESEDEVIKQRDLKPSIEESGCRVGAEIKEKSILPEKESALCAKLDVDFHDSTGTKETSIVTKVESRREDKFKIDLMAPPMASSPERDGLIDLRSETKPVVHELELKAETLVKDQEKIQKFVKTEAGVEEPEEKKMVTYDEKREVPKFDLEKPNQESGFFTSSKSQQHGHKQQQQPNAVIPKVEKAAESNKVPLPINLAGWPGDLHPLGYMPPFQTVVPMDRGTSAPIQPPQFLLSQPRPKRCVTHHHIARNIYLHQQFAKMNHFWPTAGGSASLCGAKPNNLNVVPSAENIILGKPSQGSFPGVNLNSAQAKGQATANLSGLGGKDKSSVGASFMDASQRKQFVLHQPPQPAPAGNLVHGPAFIFPLSQHQPAVAAAANQSGPFKFAGSTDNASVSGNSAAGVPVSSTAFPAMAAAVSFNYPNLMTNEGPYLTILQNNGYPFPISTSVGTSTPIRGASAQALPFVNGSFYSSQMFHTSQLQQQQPHSQPLIQAAHQNSSASSGSSSSHKQSQTQQPRRAQASGNSFLSSTSMQLQPAQKQHMTMPHQSRKLEAEMSGESTPSVADGRSSHIEKGVYGQNFTVPFQPLNFALMPSTSTVGSGGYGEKQQQLQQKNSRGGVELIPSQAFAMSFASFNGNNTASNLNFSSVAQNPSIYQTPPDRARQVYQAALASQPAQQKNHPISEGKTGGSSTNPNDGKKTILGKAPSGVGQTLVFDNSARTLNFVSSPMTNWPSTAMATSTPIAANTTNSQQQQQQLLQLHKQHVLQQQQQQQQQPVGAARSKASTASSLYSSSVAAKFSNNSPVFSQTLIQCNSSGHSTDQWKNSARTPASQAPPTSLSASNSSTLRNLPHQEVRAPQGHTQISFGTNSKSASTPHGQQIPTSSQSPALLVAGSPPTCGTLRATSTGSKASSSIPTTLQSQQTENLSTGTGQKSSPVCGRNVPSILSACPSHLSELKY